MDNLLYNKLKDYAKAICRTHAHLDHEDILHDAIIDIGAADAVMIKKRIRYLQMDRLHNVRSLKHDQKFSINETTKVCKKCNEEKPFGCFYLVTRRRTNTQEYLPNCKECHAKITKANSKKNPIPNRRVNLRYYHKKMNSPIHKEIELKRMKKHHKINREKRLPAMRENSRKWREAKIIELLGATEAAP